MTTTDIPALDFDPFSVESIAAGPTVFAEIREMAPLVWLKPYGVYATCRHEFAQKALRDWQSFTSTVKAFGEREHIPNIMVQEDPPDHSAHRNPVMKFFTPVALNNYRAFFEQSAADHADRLVETGAVDGFDDVASGYILQVFPDILGMKEMDRKQLLLFGDLAFNSTVPVNDLYKACKARSGDVLEWFNRQCQRESVTRDGLAEEIYRLGDSGEVSEQSAQLLVRAVFSGGFDTTVLSITSGLKLFAENPDQWDLLREEPKLARNAFEEVIRMEPPSRFLGRGVAAETELAGVPLKPGDKFATFLGGVGRDPRQWQDPDRFDIRRKKVLGHMSFGHGVHSCLGQGLARIEFASLFTALAKRVKRIEITGEIKRNINNQANGFHVLPLRLHAG
ncbi:cytochrome P450 [Salipiger abyssi]|uniref:Cytochrome P450 n=1 Tax=Salipiger abyssi TaxID=1250539 RepID=A0A1P8UN22_9RHOB|nr:cytochrome P450 [Salipiger abyssi]APZ50796.1 cytochrome P450 [Salipiger abyssi]